MSLYKHVYFPISKENLQAGPCVLDFSSDKEKKKFVSRELSTGIFFHHWCWWLQSSVGVSHHGHFLTFQKTRWNLFTLRHEFQKPKINWSDLTHNEVECNDIPHLWHHIVMLFNSPNIYSTILISGYYLLMILVQCRSSYWAVFYSHFNVLIGRNSGA